MVTSGIPRRLRWVVRMLDVSPEDEILEIGCGPGVAVSLICDQLTGGRITAIDRSATAIARAAKRNADHVAAGKAVLRQVDLAGLSPTDQRFDKIFAVHVNLFWVRPADAELLIIRSLLRRNGAFHLVYEVPDQEKGTRIARTVTAALTAHGFSSTISTTGPPSMLCIMGTLISESLPRQAASEGNNAC